MNRAIFFSINLTLILMFSAFFFTYANINISLENSSILSLVLIFLYAIILANSFTRDTISLDVIYWFFNYVFFGLGSYIMHQSGLWRYEVEADMYIITLFVIFFSNLIYGITYTYVYNRRIKKDDHYMQNGVISIPRLRGFIIILSIIILILFLHKGDFSGNLVRAIFEARFSPLSSMLSVIFQVTLMTLLYFSILNSKNRKTRGELVSTLIVFVLVLLLVNPFSMNRTYAFAMYFPLLIIFLTPSIRKSSIYIVILFFGILASFLQDMARNYLASEKGWIDIDSVLLNNYFYSGSFDAFESVIHSISYVYENGIVFGYQFFGALFFWIPRSIWSGKPTGSGDYISYNYLSNYNDISYGNISFPYYAEFYLNFGIIGVFVSAIILGSILARVDCNFLKLRLIVLDKSYNQKGYFTYNHVFLLYLPGVLLIMLRGDMFTAFSTLFGVFISFYIANKIIRLRIKL
jgi:oligosaccharide repeat unit polymerase